MTLQVRWLTAFVDRPAAAIDDAIRFWSAVTASPLSPVRGERGQFTTFQPPLGTPYLKAQTVLSDNGGAHLDIHVDDVNAAAEHATTLGARAHPRDGYVTLTSPAGLPWCLVPQHTATPTRPAPLTRPAGPAAQAAHSSLVDQVAIDIPAGLYETECAFWAALTGWDLRPGSRPEFASLHRPPGIPLRLLLQRLDTPPAHGRARCHLDLACTDVAAETALHQTLGAQTVARFPDWTTLTDPTGTPYCITRRDPTTGTRQPAPRG